MAKQENEELWARSIVRSFWITLTGTICVVIYIVVLAQDLPSIEQLENFDPDLVTRIYSSDGKIIHELFLENVYLLNWPAYLSICSMQFYPLKIAVSGNTGEFHCAV